ncbi:hypothetical protein BCR33DRAFT_532706 [Rhizoclosmatium globosum]|uniref:IRG-type G domain-containing protein n=1 Tax=Rhizoclosmatium globosum TaxID=329046 RepID=A0A1Y2BDX8_9FUNG|nr:hypothetical protein BCR33DRAFT_532706 [Rhizoclosmatium globosum]|eukprot:ORY32697.1 hypothetical protein BCR33DRAFT_532706 [Rhizoclosmatium globosum]
MKRISSFFGRGSSSQSKEPSSKTTNDTKEKDKDKDKPVKNSVLERLASQPFRLIVAGPRGSGATSLVTKVFGVGLGEKAEHEGEEEEVLSDVPLDDAASSGTATTATATTPTPPEKQSKKAVFVKASRWPNIDDDAKVDAAWIVVAGLPDPETLEAVNSIKALGVPLVAVLSKSDLVAVQEADAAEQMLKGLGCVVVRVSNKPDPTCSGEIIFSFQCIGRGDHMT